MHIHRADIPAYHGLVSPYILKQGQPTYIHGEPTQAVATLVFDSDIPDNAVSVTAVSTSYELLSDEDLEEIFNL